MHTAHRLDESFFERDARVVARALIGTTLVHHVGPEDVRAARIVETEAYRGPTDAACHARSGLTKRTRTLLGRPSHAYVFLIYGMYECFNIVCLRDGSGHAVLVRAVAPISGIEEAIRTDGPGRLSRALGLTRAHDGHSVTSDTLFLRPRMRAPTIATSPRVGVAYAGLDALRPWRFFDACSAHVSKPSRRSIGLG